MSLTRDNMWELRYKQLVDYKELHGNCEVPQKLGQLGRWVHRQRESKNKGFLSDDRVAKLDKLGFVWRQKSCRPTDTWDERYLQLIKYKEIHGNCNVVRTCKTSSLLVAKPSLTLFSHAHIGSLPFFVASIVRRDIRFGTLGQSSAHSKAKGGTH